MSGPALPDLTPGTILEFFEAKQILLGVCLAVKNQRMTVLTEQNREVSLARSRIIHFSRKSLDLTLTRDQLVQQLAVRKAERLALMEHVDVEQLWALTEEETEGFDLRNMAEFVFSGALGDDHIAAVQRVLLVDRLFFQCKDGEYFPRTRDQIAQRRLDLEREEAREAQIAEGAQWLQAVWQRKSAPADMVARQRVIEALKSYCLFGQESPDFNFCKDLLKRADIPQQSQSAFRLLTRLGIWHENENLFLHQHHISPEFGPEAEQLAARRAADSSLLEIAESDRRDLRDLPIFTVDSALTRDYDDALSVRQLADGTFEAGVHIADAAQYVQLGDALDREAEQRASSIYLPDGRVSMLPQSLSEGMCSLKAGEDRLALSFLLRVDAAGTVHHTEIVPSVVRVRQQLTYEAVNELLEREPSLRLLHDLALQMRAQRLAMGAIILPLPEVHVYVNSAGMIHVARHDKESPSQVMVSEWMIAANGAAATYLASREIPAIFRNQAECRPENDHVASEHEMFHIYRQRRLFARAELDTRPQMHCSIGLRHYTSVTSPIRRYVDLIVQRQLKHAIDTGQPLHSESELQQLIAKLNATQSKIFLIQRKWTRYWILKYLEQEDIHSLSALVLDCNERFAHLLLPDFLIEVNMLLREKEKVRRGEMIRIRIERINPREDSIRLQLQDPGPRNG